MVARVLLLVSLLLVIAGCDSSAPQATPTAISGTGGTGGTGGGTLAAELQGLIDTQIAAIDTAMVVADMEQARTVFKEFDASWTRIGDSVKAASPDAYTKIEEAKNTLEAELVTAETPNVVAVAGAVSALRRELRALVDTLGTSPNS